MAGRLVERVPGWVPRSLPMVQVTEEFLLTEHQVLGSEELLGAWAVLYWLGSPDGEVPVGPVTSTPGPATPERARMERAIAAELAEGASYPDGQWWARWDPWLKQRPTPQWWGVRTRVPDARAFMHGALVGLLWVTDPTPMPPQWFTPTFLGSGERVPLTTRDRAAGRLAGMWSSCDQRSGV